MYDLYHNEKSFKIIFNPSSLVHIELFIQEIGVFKNQRRGGSNITNEYTEVLRIPAEV